MSIKIQLENGKQFETIIPELLFEDPAENRPKKINNPKSFRQITSQNIRKYKKQLAKGCLNLTTSLKEHYKWDLI